jgi:transcriptional regulator with XRE-family HTH domain
VSRIERGEVSPRLDTVESLAEAMDLSVEELSFRQPSMRVKEDPSDYKGDFERLKERLDRLPSGKRQNLMRILSELLDMAESE